MVITRISKAALQYTQHNTQMVGLINSTTRMTRGTSTVRVKTPINIRTDGKLLTIPTNRGSTTVCIEERTANIKTNNNIENSKGKMIIREETMFRLDFVAYRCQRWINKVARRMQYKSMHHSVMFRLVF